MTKRRFAFNQLIGQNFSRRTQEFSVFKKGKFSYWLIFMKYPICGRPKCKINYVYCKYLVFVVNANT